MPRKSKAQAHEEHVRPPTDGWIRMGEITQGWVIGLWLGLLIVLILVRWDDWVGLARCLFRGVCS